MNEKKHKQKKCMHCGELILRKISKFDATGCQILRLTCSEFDFRWVSAPDLLGELSALPQTT